MSWLDTLSAVLFVGHSLFGQTNPAMLDQVLGPDVSVEAQIINGAPLQYNWDNGASAEGVDARARLSNGDIGALILTEAIPLANHLQWSNTEQTLAAYVDAARRANPDVRVFFQETWHSLNSGTGIEVHYDAGADIPWRDRLDRDHALWQGAVDQVNAVTGAEVTLIPVGQAMGMLFDQISAGHLVGLNGIGDVFDDDIHPNEIGFYFITMVQYAALTGQSPVGLPRQLVDRWGKAYAAPPADLARALQQIALAAVTGKVPVLEAAKASSASVKTATPTPVERPQSSDEKSKVAIGLASVKDWSPQHPFLDVMKTARPWIGHRPRQWGGMEFDEMQSQRLLDAQGWPRGIPSGIRSVGTLVLTDLPEAARLMAGRYRLRFEGNGIVEVKGRVSNIRYGRNEVQFDFTPGPGSVEVRIQKSDRKRTGDYVRNITLVPLAHADRFDAGEIFNPDFLERMQDFDTLRFMDWAETNNSELAHWDGRPKPTDFTWAQHGVPVEIMVDLANRLGVNAWFNIPHLADDGFVQAHAELVKSRLSPGLTAYVEFSNEVWNWQFTQTRWADEQAQALWSARDAGMQYYGKRAAEVAQIWSAVFQDRPDRLINVISSQTGWLGLEEAVLNTPLWRDGPAGAYFDAYAITGYFGGILGTQERAPIMREWISESRAIAEEAARDQGLSGVEFDRYLEKHQYRHANALAGRELMDGSVSGVITDTVADLIHNTWPYHAEVARSRGLELIMYEGGSHVVGIGAMADDDALTDFFTQFNYSHEMGALYKELLAGWSQTGGQMFNAYSDIYAPNKWGSWGALRFLSDDNPRWRALVNAQ